MAYVAARFTAQRFAFIANSDRFRVAVFLMGTGALLVAGIGRLGYAIQTFDGSSLAERFDERILWCLSAGVRQRVHGSEGEWTEVPRA